MPPAVKMLSTLRPHLFFSCHMLLDQPPHVFDWPCCLRPRGTARVLHFCILKWRIHKKLPVCECILVPLFYAAVARRHCRLTASPSSVAMRTAITEACPIPGHERPH
jgi:hypothetical protein